MARVRPGGPEIVTDAQGNRYRRVPSRDGRGFTDMPIRERAPVVDLERVSLSYPSMREGKKIGQGQILRSGQPVGTKPRDPFKGHPWPGVRGRPARPVEFIERHNADGTKQRIRREHLSDGSTRDTPA